MVITSSRLLSFSVLFAVGFFLAAMFAEQVHGVNLKLQHLQKVPINAVTNGHLSNHDQYNDSPTPTDMIPSDGFDRVDDPGTTASTWNDYKSICESRQQTLCSSKHICQNGSPANFIGNVFNGRDNWIAVSDGNNEWMTVFDMWGRLCKTHTQVAGGPPAWGNTKDPQSFYRAAKCCAFELDPNLDRVDNPNTAALTWSEYKAVCDSKFQRVCSSVEVCPTGIPAPFVTNVFNGKDNWIAVSDGNNEWVTVFDMGGRLCKTHTQVAGGTPGWGSTKDPQSFYRAVKCCGP